MPSSITVLMQNVFLKLFTRRHTIDKRESLENFDRLIMGIALSENIDQALIKALKKINDHVSEKLNADLFLMSPIQKPTQWLHIEQLAPTAKFLRQLDSLLPSQLYYNASYTSSAGTTPLHAMAVCIGPYADDASQTTWLTLAFKQAKPADEKIQFYMEPVVKALEEGISAWQQQQMKLQAAQAKITATYTAELHDTLLQTLGYLRIKACRLAQECQTHEQQTKIVPLCEEVSSQVKLAYRQTRDIITTSRTKLEEGSLSQLIQRAIRDFEQRSSIVFELDNRVGAKLTTQDDSQVLYIIREALSNSVRHAHASHARVIVKQHDNRHLLIRIEDNGCGIQNKEKRHDCFGMKIMRERAAKISATLNVSQRPGGGTRIDLFIRRITHD